MAKCFLGWSTYEQPADYVWPPRWIKRYFLVVCHLLFLMAPGNRSLWVIQLHPFTSVGRVVGLRSAPNALFQKLELYPFHFDPPCLSRLCQTTVTIQHKRASPNQSRTSIGDRALKMTDVSISEEASAPAGGDRPPVALEINGEWLDKYQCSGELSAWCCSFWFSYSKLEQVNTEVWLLFFFFYHVGQILYILLEFAARCNLTTAAKPSLMHCSAF